MNILEEAQQIVQGPRMASYDHPYYNFSRIAMIWSVILKQEVTAEQVGLCMIGVKLAREAFNPKRDNLVDIAGYAHTVQLVKEHEDTIS